MSGDIIDQVSIEGGVPEALPPLQRQHHRTRRLHRINARFSAEERAELEVAAASIGMTVTGFAADAALAAARGAPLVLGAAQDRESLARLQRQLFEARTAVNRFGTTGETVKSTVPLVWAAIGWPRWVVDGPSA